MWADLDFNNKKKKLKKRIKRKSEDGDAGVSSSDEEADQEAREEDEDYFQQTGNFLKNTDKKFKTKSALPKTNIDIKMCTDANKEEPHQVGF
jgi:hypothetical protein